MDALNVGLALPYTGFDSDPAIDDFNAASGGFVGGFRRGFDVNALNMALA